MDKVRRFSHIERSKNFDYKKKGINMSTFSGRNSRKWIQTSVAIVCIITGYILIQFFATMGELFVLEAKVPYYTLIYKLTSVVIGLALFITIMKHPKTSSFLSQVYTEVTKVVWPDKNMTAKHTVGVMIGVSIVGFILGFVDFVSRWGLSFFQK